MEKLIKHFNLSRGSKSELAKQLGITPSSITQWKQVPAERVLQVERITGISRNELRPDLYEVA